jgi:anaerobic dimethyl sulfoxide reductase subunit C (anchor subunit)
MLTMHSHDWALVAFTIMTQMSVGSIWTLVLVHLFAGRKHGEEAADSLAEGSLLAVVIIVVLAFAASLFHLGSPLNAPRAVANVGTSWLSREILFGVIFAVLVVVYAFLQWRKIGPSILRSIIAWLAALVGIVLVLSEGMVYYSLASQPAWNSWTTILFFFVTAGLLGALAMGVTFVANYAVVKSKEPDCILAKCDVLLDVMRWIAITSVILLGIELVVLPIYLATLATGSAAALESVQLMIGPLGWALILRIVLVFLGAGLFALFLYRNALSSDREKVLATLVYIAFGLVLVAEVLGRIMFYATHVNIGL